MSSKKLVSVVLTASTLVWGLGIATLPLANAQTTASIQAQIAALLAQIQQLQAQLGTSGGSSMSTSYNFTRDLTVGSTGADVSALQQLLINAGDLAISAPTGYFGPLTKAALAKYQAANGISPAAGYFGPITRAYVASKSVASTGTGTGTGTGTSTTSTVTPPATGLAVSLASDNPVAGNLISSAPGASTAFAAARVPVLAVNLTASNSGAVTVTDLKVNKTGVLSDSSISGAYLVQNGQVLYQYTSLNQGVIDFSSLNLTIPAGQTEELQVAIDPSTGLYAGNTVGFTVNAASDVTAVDANNNAITPSGSFPLTGNIFTVTSVTSPSLATLSIASTSIGTQVTAGTQNNIVGSWTLTGSNNLTYLKGIKFTVIGSATPGDIRNIKLNVNGTQVGPTLSTLPPSGVAYFDLSSAPASINTGANNLQVYADVMGSPNKQFQFEILNTYDVLAVDSQYNVPIKVSFSPSGSGAGTLVGIQQGQITVTQDTNTPTGNIAVGQSGVTLAKFDIYAAGEAVKVQFLGFKLAFTGVTTSSADTAISNFVKNVALTDDAGGQVGTTINTPPSGNSCDVTTGQGGYTSATNGTITSATVNYVDCFGTSASPINYIVPANTTRVISLKADIQSLTGGATFSNVTASLLGETNNLQGLTSSAQSSSAGATGSALTLQSTLLTVAENSAYGNQNVTPNSTDVHIGSYAFSASSASGVQINTVSVKAGTFSGAGNTLDIQNLKVLINGTAFGTTQGQVSDGSTYTFSGSPFTVPAGGTTNVDVYADLTSNSASSSPATQLTGCSGSSVVSYSAVSCPSTAVSGQNLTVQSTGATVAVGLDSSNPASANLVMGSTGNTLAAYRFTETSNVENVKITDLTITQNAATTSQSAYQVNGASGLQLYNGSTLVGTSGSAATSSAGYTYKFHFATAPVVPQNGNLILTLKAGVASFTSGGATDLSTSTFAIAATSSVTAVGQSSNLASTISGTATGNTMTVLQTTLTPSFTANLQQSGNVKTVNQNIAAVTVSANSGGSGVLRTLKLTFSGGAISASTTVNDFALLGSNTVNVTSSVANGGWAAVQSGSCSAGSCPLTWTFPTSTNPLVVTAGGSYTFTVQLMPSALGASTADLAAASGQNPVSISMTIAATGDMTYYDNSQATGSTISLPSTLINSLTAVTVSYSS